MRRNVLLWVGALALMGAASCSDCKNDDPAPPTIPEGFDTEGSGQAVTDDDDGPQEPEVESDSELPPHEGPPSVEAFAVTPVTGDWTMYRGNEGRSGLRDVRAIETPRVAWSVEVGIQGYANTPILADGRIYLSSQGLRHDRADDRDGVVAISQENGSAIWRQQTDHDANGMTLADGILVVGTDSDKVYAFRAESGEELWQVEVGCKVVTAPLVHDLWVHLIRNDGQIARIALRTGEIDGELPPCRASERGGMASDGDYIMVNASTTNPFALEDGERLWTARPPADRFGHFGTWTPPLMTDEMVVFAYHRWPVIDDAGSRLYRPHAVARYRDNGQLAWTADVNDPALRLGEEPRNASSRHLRTMPWILGNRMYWTPTTLPEISVYDLTTGDHVGSIELPDCRRRQFPSIVGTPTMGYLARHDGMLHAFRPEENGGEIAWSLALGDREALGNNVTYEPVAEDGGCSERPINGRTLFSTPAIGENGFVYVGTGDGWLYAIKDVSW